MRNYTYTGMHCGHVIRLALNDSIKPHNSDLSSGVDMRCLHWMCRFLWYGMWDEVLHAMWH